MSERFDKEEAAKSLKEGQAWESFGECTREDPELFFKASDTAVSAAQEICRRCVVRYQCLETALNEHRDYGVWGWLSESERRRLRRRSINPGAA